MRKSGSSSPLKDDLEAKLNLTWRSEREHASSYPDAIGIVRRRTRTVDRTCSASKEAGHSARWQVEVGKVENIVEPN